MNKFEFKNLVKNLEKSLKQRTFFKTLRTEVNTGAKLIMNPIIKLSDNAANRIKEIMSGIE